jgi:hypothetical protein
MSAAVIAVHLLLQTVNPNHPGRCAGILILRSSVMTKKRVRRKHPWWWLSFCDPDLPEGQCFLGVAVVQAPDFLEAIRFANRLEINPGGEVAGWKLSTEDTPPDAFRYRLLQQADIIEWQGEAHTLGDALKSVPQLTGPAIPPGPPKEQP